VRRSASEPASGRLYAAGFVVSFAFVALALNEVAAAPDFDPDTLRKAGLALLLVFGALMIWPTAFERVTAGLADAGIAVQGQRPPKPLWVASFSARRSD
jgi:hypothetical protein